MALVGEISLDISKLNDYPWSTLINKLDEINIKLEYAKKQWININKLYSQVLEFRLLSFLKNIDKKIEDIKIKWDFFNTNISKILIEYNKLQRFDGIDLNLLKDKIEYLDTEIKKWRLFSKVKDISNSGWTSIYSLEEIEKEYTYLKNKWLDIQEIEEILFEI
jgi:hypothetical protein